MARSVFQGPNIYLRPFEPDDLPALYAYLNHPDLAGRRYVPWKFPEFVPLSHGQVEAIYQKWSEAEKSFHLAVVSETGELIGHAECDWEWDPHCPSLSTVIAPAHQRQGYGVQVLDLLLRYLFDYTPAHNVSCWFADWNQAARHFAARCGFQKAGRMRRVGIRQSQYYDMLLADMLRPEWQERSGGNHGA